MMRSWLTLALVAVILAVAMAKRGGGNNGNGHGNGGNNGKGGNGVGAPGKGAPGKGGPSFDDVNCFKKRACKAVPKPQRRACKRHCRRVRRQSRPRRSLWGLFRRGYGIRRCHREVRNICHPARGPKAAERCEQGAKQLGYAQQREESLKSKRTRLEGRRDEVCAAAEAAEEGPAEVDLEGLQANVTAAEQFLNDTIEEQDLLVEAAREAMHQDDLIYFADFLAERDACLAQYEGLGPDFDNEREFCFEVFYNVSEERAISYTEPFTSFILNTRWIFFNTTEDAKEIIDAARDDLNEAKRKLEEAEAAGTEDPCGVQSLVQLQRQCRRLNRRLRRQKRRVRRYGRWVELITNCFERACPDHVDDDNES